MTRHRRRWLRLAAYALVVAVFVWQLWSVALVQRSQCEAFEQFARSLGTELGADAARIDRFVDRLHADLESC